MQDHELAVTAHWMLGRLAVLQATNNHLLGNDHIDPASHDLLLARSRQVMDEMQRVVEDLARGLPPLSIELHHASDRLEV